MQLENISRTSIHALAASGALDLIDDRKPLFSHMHGIEQAGPNTVPVSHASVRTLFVSPQEVGSITGRDPEISAPVFCRLMGSPAVDASHSLDEFSRFHAQDRGHVLGHVCPTHRASVGLSQALYNRFGKGPATGKPACATIGLWKGLGNLFNFGILFHSEFFVSQDQSRGKQKS
jgi:hypothetical protein